MKSIFNVTKVLFVCILAILMKPATAAPQFIDASVDLTRLKIADTNAIGDGTTDSSVPVQAAIDYLTKNPDGGSLIFGPGVYRIAGINVKPHVKIVGADREKTIFRASAKGIMIHMEGGELHNFTAFGTPDEASSGDNWIIGKEGSALASFVIHVGDTPRLIAKDVIISNVTAKECTVDAFYSRGSQNMQVLNSEFDRAGRNIISLVGNDNNFLFSGCHFGSLWGLYHSDIEPNSNHHVRDGMFLNCVFDGSHAGEMKTDVYSKMFIFSNTAQSDNHNISVVGCTFNDIKVRIKGIFPNLKFLYNPQLGQFIRTSNNRIGELPDATLRGNHFGTPEKPIDNITAGVTFTGNTIFEDNTPAAANDTMITVKSTDSQVTQEPRVEVVPTPKN